MGKWIKRTVVLGMAAAIFVLCCSCSLVRDFDVLMGGMQSAASTRAPRLNELPELPAPAQQGEEEAMPENTPLPSPVSYTHLGFHETRRAQAIV